MSFAKLALVGLPLVGAAMFLAFPAFAADPEPNAAPADDDGARFRGGVALTGGALLLSGNAAGVGGVDGRMGVQIMDLIGVYLQPQLALGATSTVFAGMFGASVLADVTIIDQIFVGAGGGFGAVQFNRTQGAGALHIRAGGYPLMGYGDDGIRRKGLMLGMDFRVFFAGGATLIAPMGSIGYEAF
jgi:hypothetical protein